MIRTARAALRLARAVLHALHGVAVVLVGFGALARAEREARIRWWAAKLLRVMGIELVVRGAPQPGAKLIVANHVSWLDIMAVHASCPEARFVSKASVRHWPLINRLVASANTLYLERERKRDALRVVHLMAEAMTAGDTVAVFPEGTTGDGRELLPFHANLLQAAIATGTGIQAVALRFSDPLHPVSPAAEFVGDTTLAQSLWRLVGAQGLKVTVHWLACEAAAHDADRRALAAALRERIARALDG